MDIAGFQRQTNLSSEFCSVLSRRLRQLWITLDPPPQRQLTVLASLWLHWLDANVVVELRAEEIDAVAAQVVKCWS